MGKFLRWECIFQQGMFMIQLCLYDVMLFLGGRLAALLCGRKRGATAPATPHGKNSKKSLTRGGLLMEAATATARAMPRRVIGERFPWIGPMFLWKWSEMSDNRFMRLVVSIDDLVAESAKQYASAHAVTLDKAVEDLLRQSLIEPGIHVVDGFAEFILPPGTPVLTTQELLGVEDEF
jgi:hypothetical protein